MFWQNFDLIVVLAFEQDGEGANRPPLLAHQLSLPNTSAEMSAIEKFLQFSDSVPFKIRAKRGCATHPRSIAERVKFFSSPKCHEINKYVHFHL